MPISFCIAGATLEGCPENKTAAAAAPAGGKAPGKGLTAAIFPFGKVNCDWLPLRSRTTDRVSTRFMTTPGASCVPGAKGLAGLSPTAINARPPPLLWDITPSSLKSESAVTITCGKSAVISVGLLTKVVSLASVFAGAAGGPAAIRNHQNITMTDSFAWIIHPTKEAALHQITDQYGKSAIECIRENFKNLEIVLAPECRDAQGIHTMFLIAKKVKGEDTVLDLFTTMLKGFPLIQSSSMISQKFAASTSGAGVVYPFAISRMKGV